jgi:hypothetical protein
VQNAELEVLQPKPQGVRALGGVKKGRQRSMVTRLAGSM